MDYPIDVRIPYGDGTRSRGLAVAGIFYFVKALLLLPHLIILYFVAFVASLLGWFGYFAILFTGRQPEGFDRAIGGTIGWYTRVYAWLASLTDVYPPFALEAADHPAVLTVRPDPGERNRLLGLSGIFGLKFLLALPHFIVLGLVGFVAGIAAWIGFFMIAFTGTLPRGIHDLVTGTMRWGARVYAWVGSLTDRYPPFSLE